jgi:hypothetical protein
MALIEVMDPASQPSLILNGLGSNRWVIVPRTAQNPPPALVQPSCPSIVVYRTPCALEIRRGFSFERLTCGEWRQNYQGRWAQGFCAGCIWHGGSFGKILTRKFCAKPLISLVLLEQNARG